MLNTLCVGLGTDFGEGKGVGVRNRLDLLYSETCSTRVSSFTFERRASHQTFTRLFHGYSTKNIQCMAVSSISSFFRNVETYRSVGKDGKCSRPYISLSAFSGAFASQNSGSCEWLD